MIHNIESNLWVLLLFHKEGQQSLTCYIQKSSSPILVTLEGIVIDDS